MDNYLLSQDKQYDLWLLMTRTHYWINRARGKELRQYNLSPEQAGILWITRALGNHVMPIEIARHMLREPQTITSILDRMGKKGLITKTKDLKRRNVVRVSLTAKGRKAYRQAVKRESVHTIMSTLSKEKQQYLQEALHDLMKAAKSFIARASPDSETF